MVIQDPSRGHLCERIDAYANPLTTRPTSSAIHPAPPPRAINATIAMAVSVAATNPVFLPGNCCRIPLVISAMRSAPIERTAIPRPPTPLAARRSVRLEHPGVGVDEPDCRIAVVVPLEGRDRVLIDHRGRLPVGQDA